VKNVKNQQGFSIAYMLFLMVIISTLFLFTYSTVLVGNYITIRQVKKEELKLKNRSVFNLSVNNKFSPGSVDTTAVVKKHRWGFYLITEVTNYNKFYKLNDIYTSGVKIPAVLNYGLVLTRPNLRASVTGETKITGNLLVTRDRIQNGRITGIPYQKEEYLKGEVVESENLNPDIVDDSLFLSLYDYFNAGDNYIYEYREISFNDSSMVIDTVFIPDSLFIDRDITGERYKVIFCEGGITTGENISLTRVALIAKGKINIGAGNKIINSQIFSMDDIIISESDVLYPSVICSYTTAEDSAFLSRKIEIKNSTINGSVLLLSKSIGLQQNRSKIYIDEDSFVQGVLYCENNLDLRAELFGSAFTHNLLFEKERSVYLNWLVGLKINRDSLDNSYTAPVVFNPVGGYDLIEQHEEWSNIKQ